MVWCLLISIFGNVLSSTTSSVLFYSISRLICVASIPVQTVLKSIVTELSESNEESSKILRKLGCIGTVSFMIGRVVGGHSGDYVRGIDYVYTSMIANILISVVLVKFLPEVSSKKSKKAIRTRKNVNILGEAFKEASSVFMDLKKILALPEYRDVFATKLFVEYVSAINVNALGTMLATDYKMPMAITGYLLVFNMIVPIVTSLFVDTVNSKCYAKDSSGCRRKLWHFTLVQVVGYVTLSLTSHLLSFVMVMLTNSCAKPFIDSALDDLLLLEKTRWSKEKQKMPSTTAVANAFRNTVSVAQIIGPVTAGIASYTFSVRTSFVVCALFTIIANRLSKS